MDSFDFTFRIAKADPTGGYVRGWASVISDGGKAFVDHSGDTISPLTLRKAAHDFIREHRVAKVMHQGEKVGEIVESVLVDDDFVKAMGATITKRGWWIGGTFTDPAIRKAVREGRLPHFSIGGFGRRKAITKSMGPPAAVRAAVSRRLYGALAKV